MNVAKKRRLQTVVNDIRKMDGYFFCPACEKEHLIQYRVNIYSHHYRCTSCVEKQRMARRLNMIRKICQAKENEHEETVPA